MEFTKQEAKIIDKKAFKKAMDGYSRWSFVHRGYKFELDLKPVREFVKEFNNYEYEFYRDNFPKWHEEKRKKGEMS